MQTQWATLDGNEAAARIAYALSEVVAIYPITPASPMGEMADNWASSGTPNVWGLVPDVVEMQSEAGAAGALHGALQKGALATTFTASQGLLLMVPNMYKIAGELTPAVMHVAARSVATHALSIFGDHSDVMHARSTGWALLSSASVQEAHDLALVAHVATLRSHVPFIHFFDGFRTSHEIDRIALIDEDHIVALAPDEEVLALRARGLDPDRPVVRGTAQNPDAFFQAREACNPYYDATPGIVAEVMHELALRVGRQYGLVEYEGAEDADRVVVLMGSGIGAAQEAVEALTADGEKVGLLKVRLYRPFPSAELVAALPPTVRSIAVLDRTKEPGSLGEPLYLDVVAALAEQTDQGAAARFERLPHVIGGRYGLSSKEFRPEMVAGVFRELAGERPKRHFTVGIRDDVTHLSIDPEPELHVRRPQAEVQALFFGLGSDGTVGANKNSVKIIGEHTDLWAQGYFEYDSKKSGSVTVSHLRFGPEPIRSTYLISDADFVACHQFGLLERMKILDRAKDGATFLLNSPYPAAEVWERLPAHVRQQIVEKRLELWVIDAYAIADEVGMGSRINTVMQPCFFKLSGVLPADEAIARIKESVEKTYGNRGPTIVERNNAAIDRSLEALTRVEVPVAGAAVKLEAAVPDREGTAGAAGPAAHIPADAPAFVKRVTARLMAGEGELLPVSAFPPDGTFPTATSRYEKRAIAQQIPIWDPAVCIQCGKCAMVCPHATIRMKIYPPEALEGAPEGFKHVPVRTKDFPDHELTVQVAPDDCTGCGVCTDVCPGKSKTQVRHKAIDMHDAIGHRPAERQNWEFFQQIPRLDRTLVDHSRVRATQQLEPLFEFSGACAGCGETPYLRLVSQLFGDRMIVANATGCSSIYGGNLPTTPWAVDADGRGPAWNNSLFEDAAEFGLGMRLGHEAQAEMARLLLTRLERHIGEDLVAEILTAEQSDEAQIAAQRQRLVRVADRLPGLAGGNGSEPELALLAAHLQSVLGDLVERGIWIVGGDGWAYDIGFGGLDHVLALGRNVNVLVLDTEVYSNTGGQASKATSRGAVAKFAAMGKETAKKDLGAIARAYGNVYVAQIALGANDVQATRALLEADAWPGPSLVIAYSTCIAHGIDMSMSMTHQKDAVRCGYWPLYRYTPTRDPEGQPFRLDSKKPQIPLPAFASTEARFAILKRADRERFDHLMALAQADVLERWRFYEQLAEIERTVPVDPDAQPDVESDAGYRYDQEDLRWAV